MGLIMWEKRKGDIWDDSCDSPSIIMRVLVTLTEGETGYCQVLYILFLKSFRHVPIPQAISLQSP